uniref:Uncharacterized protein n=1 Tax=Dactylella sp. TaxID=1814903 RepID=A0A482DRI8_9PEZI|nr:hypothetical protein [Dactylella sp.]
MILSKIPDNNKVKNFLKNGMNYKIEVYAKEHEQTENILNYVSKIENYSHKYSSFKGVSCIIETSINNILRYKSSYKSSHVLNFKYAFIASDFYMDLLKNQWILERIYKNKMENFISSHVLDKSNNKSVKLLNNSLFYFNNNYHILKLNEKIKCLKDFKNFIDIHCCCYAIIKNNCITTTSPLITTEIISP